MKHGKKYQDSVKLIDHLNQYDPDQAAQLVVSTGKAKFDETVEVSIRLGVDPRHADQQVRGAVVLPNGTGKTVRVCAIAKSAASACWSSLRARRLMKPARLALTTSAIRT